MTMRRHPSVVEMSFIEATPRM